MVDRLAAAAVAAVPVVRLARHAALEVTDAVFQVARLARADAVALGAIDAALEVASLVVEAARLADDSTRRLCITRMSARMRWTRDCIDCAKCMLSKP